MPLPEWMRRRLKGEAPEGAEPPAPTSPYHPTKWTPGPPFWERAKQEREAAPAMTQPYLPTVMRGPDLEPTPWERQKMLSQGPGPQPVYLPTTLREMPPEESRTPWAMPPTSALRARAAAPDAAMRQAGTPPSGAAAPGIRLPMFQRPERQYRLQPPQRLGESFPATRAEMRMLWGERKEEVEGGIVPAWQKLREAWRGAREADPFELGAGPVLTFQPSSPEDVQHLADMEEKKAALRKLLFRGVGLTTSPARSLMRQPGLIGQIPKTVSAGLQAGLAPTDIGVEEIKGRFFATPRVYEDLAREYGESPELREAALLTGSIAWSGYERQRRAAERMYHGESYESALYGDYEAAEPVRAVALANGAVKDPETREWSVPDQALPIVVNAIQRTPDVREFFGYEVEVRGKDPREVAMAVLNEGVEGEHNAIAELAGRVIFDIGNIVGAIKFGGKLLGKAGLLESRFWDDVAQAGAKLDMRHADEIYETSKAERWWNLLEPLPETKQDVAINLTRDIITDKVVQLTKPEDQLRAMDAFAKLAGPPKEVEEAVQILDDLGLGRHTIETAEEARHFGRHFKVGDVISPLESEAGKLGSYTWRRMLSPEGEYNPAALEAAVKRADKAEDGVRLLIHRMVSTAEKMYPSQPTGVAKATRGLVKANRAIKGFFAKFLHMGYTTAYAFRNMVQNTVQGVIDGVHPFVRRSKVADLWEDFGMKPTAALRGLGAGGPGGELLHENARAWAKMQGEEKVTTAREILFEKGPALWASGQAEILARETAVYHGITKVMNRWLRPGMIIPRELVDELAAKTNPRIADAVLSHVMSTYNPKHWDEIVQTVSKEAEVVETWRHLDPQTTIKLREVGMLDEVRELLQKADSPDAWARGIDGLVDRAFNRSQDFAEDTAIPDGTQMADAKKAIEALISDLGWEELPKPLKGRITMEHVKEGARVLARNHERIQGAKDRAAYHVIEAGDENLMLELIEAYARMEGEHGTMLGRLAEFRQSTWEQANAAAEAENWSEAARVWQFYNKRAPEIVFEHYDDLVDTFGDIAQRAKEMGASEHTEDLMRVLNAEIGSQPAQIHVDVGKLARQAQETLQYGRGQSLAGARAHMAHTLAQEFEEVTGTTVNEKLDSFARAVEEGRLDQDEVWDVLRQHQIKRGRLEGELAEEIIEEAPKVEEVPKAEEVIEAERVAEGIEEEAPRAAETIREATAREVTQEVTRFTQAPSIEDPTQTYQFRHKIVDLDELTPSHQWKGNQLVKAGDYPAELQKRIRERGASRMQVQEIAQKLRPDMLIEDTRSIDRGSPIVGADNVVESGNGRVLALQRARDFVPEKWDEYVTYLREHAYELGLDPEDLQGIRHPVLVRERVSDVNRVEFAAEANRPVTMMMSAFENAVADAEVIDANRMANLEMGATTDIEDALRAQQNKPFVDSFLNKLPKTERAALVDKTGSLNAQGIERLKWAMFRKVYSGDSGQRLVQAFMESADPTMLNVRQAMLDSLPQMARAEALIDAGRRDDALRLGDDIAAAVDQYRRVKADPSISVSQYINQPKLFGQPDLTPAQFELLKFIHEQGLRRKVPFRDLLRGYAEWVRGLPEKAQMGFGGMMGPARKTKPEVLSELAESIQPEAEGLFAGLEEGARIATGGAPRREELAGEAARVVERAEEEVRRVAGGAGEAAEGARRAAPGEAGRLADDAADLVAEAPEEWVTKEQEVRAVFRRLGELLDDGHIPTPREMANGMAPEIESELLKLRDDVLARWGEKTGGVEDVEAVQDFLQTLRPRVAALRQNAWKLGEEAANFAYHNYGDKRKIDTLMGFVWMYPFWYTRTYTKWAKRLMDQPHLLGAYYDFKDYLHEVNEGLPPWWKDQIKVGHVFGEDYYIPLESLINPLVGLVDHFRTDERAETEFFGTPAGKVIQELGAWGPSTHMMLGYTMALSAWANGDTDAALQWMGYQSQWTKLMPNLTAKMREWVPATEQVIPPGGGGPELWMWEMTDLGPRYRGTTYDRKRIGSILGDMVRDGRISPAQADLAAYFTSGEVYDEALQQHALDKWMPNLISWGLGAGLKPRHVYEAEISEMWESMGDLHAARDAGTLTDDEYSAAWRAFKRQYPYFNAIMMARMDKDGRDESLAWSVVNRLPPGWQREETFENEDVEELLHKFYDTQGDMSDWSEDERRKFMAGVIKLAREKPYPTQRQQLEWEEARRRYYALREEGADRFGEDIIELEDQYWELPQDQRTEFAEEHEQLQAYWDWWDQAKRQDPLVNKYYERPPEFWTQSDARGAFYDTYFGNVPPGETEWALKEDLPLLSAMRDYDVRGWLQEQGWTVEQYKAAMAQVEQWLEEHPGEVKGNQMEWEQARQLNDLYWDYRESIFPRYSELIEDYMELDSRDAKTAFKAQNPELEAFWAWRDQFARKHPLWAKYYRSEEYTAPSDRQTGTGVREVRSWSDFLRIANPLAVQQLFATMRGQEQDARALRELYNQYGQGSYQQWIDQLAQMYARQ